MELIRRNSDYALRSLLYMVKPAKGKRITIESLAKKQKVPVAFLRKIFQRLARGRIVASQPGPNGGFFLVRKPSDVTLKEILETVQGEVSLSDCVLDRASCSRSRTCNIRSGLREIQGDLIDLLNKYSLKDFLAPLQTIGQVTGGNGGL